MAFSKAQSWASVSPHTTGADCSSPFTGGWRLQGQSRLLQEMEAGSGLQRLPGPALLAHAVRHRARAQRLRALGHGRKCLTDKQTFVGGCQCGPPGVSAAASWRAPVLRTGETPATSWSLNHPQWQQEGWGGMLGAPSLETGMSPGVWVASELGGVRFSCAPGNLCSCLHSSGGYKMGCCLLHLQPGGHPWNTSEQETRGPGPNMETLQSAHTAVSPLQGEEGPDLSPYFLQKDQQAGDAGRGAGIVGAHSLPPPLNNDPSPSPSQVQRRQAAARGH